MQKMNIPFRFTADSFTPGLVLFLKLNTLLIELFLLIDFVEALLLYLLIEFCLKVTLCLLVDETVGFKYDALHAASPV